MKLGKFSVSLTVKDLAASRAFYEALGFVQVGGDPSQNWIILDNAGTTIGLFQGMFEKNSLTFNPGWDANAQPLAEFTDVRELEAALKAKGIEPVAGVSSPSGPGYCVLADPDGNPVLLDQHV